jgi:hypothetical protein
MVPNVLPAVARNPSSESGGAFRSMNAEAAGTVPEGGAICASFAVPRFCVSAVKSSAALAVAPGRETEAAHGSPSVCCDTASPEVRGQGLVDVDVGAVALTVDAVAPVPFCTVSVVPDPGDTEKDPFVGTSVGTEP